MITELTIADVSIDVIFKNIKNVHLSVYPPTGRVRVSAPDHMSLDTVRLFAVSKINWIRRHQNKVQQQERETPREYLERESHYLWGRRYLLQLDEESGRPSVAIGNRTIEMTIPLNATTDYKRQFLGNLYRDELRIAAQPIVEKWERRLDVTVKRVYIQKMRTKWGSSNPHRNSIRLNLDLAKFPLECLDYVILHEVAHFIVPNHSNSFVSLLDQFLPGWHAIRDRLNEGPLSAFE